MKKSAAIKLMFGTSTQPSGKKKSKTVIVSTILATIILKRWLLSLRLSMRRARLLVDFSFKRSTLKSLVKRRLLLFLSKKKMIF